ncbi:hypothetical protein ACJW31_12G182600 [Castanea mollissima]
MDLSWWFRRTTKSSNQHSPNPNPNPPKPQNEEEELGITEQLIDFVKSFTFDTFKNFPLQDDDDDGGSETAMTTSSSSSSSRGNVRNDLSEWQQRHATLVLSKIKEISKLRYMLCPRHLKERQFWRIYFKLVKSHIAEYELCAIQLEKLKTMATENEKSSDISPYEVEMAETKHTEHISPPSP